MLSEFIGWEEGCVDGRMGNIRGRPTEWELSQVTENTAKLVHSLKNR